MMSFPINQSRNNVSQCTQGEIDFRCFLHAIPSRSSLTSPFRTSKIN
jgi:hypothetical protein